MMSQAAGGRNPSAGIPVDTPGGAGISYPMEHPIRPDTPAVSSRKGSGDRRASRIQEVR